MIFYCIYINTFPYYVNINYYLEETTPRRSQRKRSQTQFFGHVWCVECLLQDWIGEGGIVISDEENISDAEDNNSPVSIQQNIKHL